MNRRIAYLLSSLFITFTILVFANASQAAPYPLQEVGGGTATNATSSAGQILISTGSSTYTPAFVQCVGGCTVTSASGTVTINAASSSALTGYSTSTYFAVYNTSGTLMGYANLTFASSTVTITGAGGDSISLNSASGFTLLNGNNGWGINAQSDYFRLVGGGEGHVELEFSTDTGISRDSAGVLDIGNGTYQDQSGAIILKSISASGNVTTTNLTISGLGSSGNPCLVVSSAGVVSTSTCGSGAGGVATSGTPLAGQGAFFNPDGNTITGALGITVNTSTNVVQVNPSLAFYRSSAGSSSETTVTQDSNDFLTFQSSGGTQGTGANPYTLFNVEAPQNENCTSTASANNPQESTISLSRFMAGFGENYLDITDQCYPGGSYPDVEDVIRQTAIGSSTLEPFALEFTYAPSYGSGALANVYKWLTATPVNNQSSTQGVTISLNGTTTIPQSLFVGGTINVTSTATFAGAINQSGAVNSIASTTVNGSATTTSLGVTGVAHFAGAITASSSITQTGAVNSIASTTIAGNATTTSLTVTGVPNAILVGGSGGAVSAYAGSSCTSGVVSGLSASGTAACTATSTLLSGYSTSTPTSLTGPYLATSGSQITVSSTLASSSAAFPLNATTSFANGGALSIAAGTVKNITNIMCFDTVGSAATTTVEVYYNTTLASSGIQQVILSSLVCGVGGNSTTTFTTSTLPATAYLWVEVTSTTATSQEVATTYIQATKL